MQGGDVVPELCAAARTDRPFMTSCASLPSPSGSRCTRSSWRASTWPSGPGASRHGDAEPRQEAVKALASGSTAAPAFDAHDVQTLLRAVALLQPA